MACRREDYILPVVAVASSVDPCQQYLKGKLQAKSYPLAKNHGDKGFADVGPRLSEISGINAESFESRVGELFWSRLDRMFPWLSCN